MLGCRFSCPGRRQKATGVEYLSATPACDIEICLENLSVSPLSQLPSAYLHWLSALLFPAQMVASAASGCTGWFTDPVTNRQAAIQLAGGISPPPCLTSVISIGPCHPPSLRCRLSLDDQLDKARDGEARRRARYAQANPDQVCKSAHKRRGDTAALSSTMFHLSRRPRPVVPTLLHLHLVHLLTFILRLKPSPSRPPSFSGRIGCLANCSPCYSLLSHTLIAFYTPYSLFFACRASALCRSPLLSSDPYLHRLLSVRV